MTVQWYLRSELNPYDPHHHHLDHLDHDDHHDDEEEDCYLARRQPRLPAAGVLVRTPGERSAVSFLFVYVYFLYFCIFYFLFVHLLIFHFLCHARHNTSKTSAVTICVSFFLLIGFHNFLFVYILLLIIRINIFGGQNKCDHQH